MTYIYALRDPRDDQFRYIGKADDPSRRLVYHLEQMVGANTHKNGWLRQLKALGLEPSVVVLEKVAADADWRVAERRWIRQLRAEGVRLTNGTEGGEGGYIPAAWSPEARAKRLAKRRLPTSDETKAKISAANRGRKSPHSKPPHLVGVQQAKAKLTDELVVELRQYVRAGGRLKAWAEAHGITVACASYAARGDTWTHVPDPVPKVHKQRLSDDDVVEMRRLFAAGVPRTELAERFGCTSSHVSRVVRGLNRR